MMTPEQFIFDSLTHIIIIVSSIIMFMKTAELFSLSGQKGLGYFSRAMAYYSLGFSALYLLTIAEFIFGDVIRMSIPGLFAQALTLYLGFNGGFYLGYCLVWRRFEADKFKRSNALRYMFLILFAILVVGSDIYLMIYEGARTPFIFFSLMILWLLYAIISNYIRCCQFSKDYSMSMQFISLVALGLGIYIALLVESMFEMYFPPVHFYVLGLVTVFTLAVLYNVVKITK